MSTAQKANKFCFCVPEWSNFTSLAICTTEISTQQLSTKYQVTQGQKHSQHKRTSAQSIVLGQLQAYSLLQYRTHLILRPPLFADHIYLQVWGGLIIENDNQSRLYAPFSRCGAREGNSNGRIVRHRLVWLKMKLRVAQFCRAKDQKIINEGAECEWPENAMQFSHHHQRLDISLPPCSQSLGRCIAGQQVARLHIQCGTVSSTFLLFIRVAEAEGGVKWR